LVPPCHRGRQRQPPPQNSRTRRPSRHPPRACLAHGKPSSSPNRSAALQPLPPSTPAAKSRQSAAQRPPCPLGSRSFTPPLRVTSQAASPPPNTMSVGKEANSRPLLPRQTNVGVGGPSPCHQRRRLATTPADLGRPKPRKQPDATVASAKQQHLEASTSAHNTCSSAAGDCHRSRLAARTATTRARRERGPVAADADRALPGSAPRWRCGGGGRRWGKASGGGRFPAGRSVSLVCHGCLLLKVYQSRNVHEEIHACMRMAAL
jgi:hypothetical protein